ncbi:hypothetical protein [Mesorhizobium sp. M0085]|uniref:hypothetical protein n=1 Tax=Mesorhizobium sp. M0085 TaxID=2956872 RepID=UPI00333CED2C
MEVGQGAVVAVMEAMKETRIVSQKAGRIGLWLVRPSLSVHNWQPSIGHGRNSRAEPTPASGEENASRKRVLSLFGKACAAFPRCPISSLEVIAGRLPRRRRSASTASLMTFRHFEAKVGCRLRAFTTRRGREEWDR